MNILAELPYIKVVRTITWNQQQSMEEYYQLQLLDDAIISNTEQFAFHEVFDISHRPMSDNKGFLYLHTNSGVYSYYIKTDPAQFINLYKEIKQVKD